MNDKITKSKISLSAIMPVYNEELLVAKAIDITYNSLNTVCEKFELIIVNDCSTDKSAEIIEKIIKEYESIKLIHHKKNLGIGGAFKTGVENANNDFVILVPVDNPLEIEELLSYLDRASVCDIVVGCRIERVGYTMVAKTASFVYNRILIPLLFNIGLEDVNWIQLYKRVIFAEKIIEIENNGIFFLAEILIKAKRAHLIIAEVPTKMKKRLHGKPTCFKYSAMFKTFINMMKLFFDLNSKKMKRTN